jgi:hypothetical protein
MYPSNSDEYCLDFIVPNDEHNLDFIVPNDEPIVIEEPVAADVDNDGFVIEIGPQGEEIIVLDGSDNDGFVIEIGPQGEEIIVLD